MNFEEVAGLDEVPVSAETRDDDGNPYISPQLDDILSRPLKATTIEWTTATSPAVFMDFSPLNIWLNNPLVQSVLKKFRYYAADFEVRFELQSTIMHYGKLAMAFLPCWPSNGDAEKLLAADLFALDVHILDAAQPEVITIKCPFMYPLKWWSVADAFDDQHNDRVPLIMTRVLAPLASAQMSTAAVPITAFVQAKNVRLAGPIAENDMAAPSPSMFQSSGGDLPMTKARAFRRTATDPVPQYISMRPMAPVGQSLEEDTVVRLSLNGHTEMDTSDQMVQALVPDETNVLNVCKRPFLLDTIKITQVTTGNFWSCPVSPAHAVGPDTADKRLVNAQLVSRMATYWHGSMKYAFMFSAAHITTTRIAVVLSYGKPSTQTATPDDHVAAVWDICGTTTKTLTVPFLSDYPYIPIPSAITQDNYATSYGMPTIKLVVINPVTSGSVQGIAPHIWCNVLASVGDDFRLFLPRGFDAAHLNFAISSYNQINVKELFDNDFDTLGEKGTEIHIPEFNFEEEFLDIKDLLCRYSKPVDYDPATPLVRSLPDGFRYLFRFTRYGARYKISNKTLMWAEYSNSKYTGDFSLPPWDIAGSYRASVLQVEMPYYEAWYFDLPGTVPTTATKITRDEGNPLHVMKSVSADSVFSFWTFAVRIPGSP